MGLTDTYVPVFLPLHGHDDLLNRLLPLRLGTEEAGVLPGRMLR